MSTHNIPATRQAIFDQLLQLDPAAASQILDISACFQSKNSQSGLAQLKTIDAGIGGFGLHSLQSGNSPGYPVSQRNLYRPVQYVHMSLQSRNPSGFTRFLVEMACAHVEASLKQVGQSGFLGNWRSQRQPMGSLLHKQFKGKIPEQLFEHLLWLNNSIYRFAKHEFGPRLGKSATDSFFDLDEAIAIYLIARHLVVQLDIFLKKQK